MDIFNKNKLHEKEEIISKLNLHIQQLETTIKILKHELSNHKSIIDNLSKEKTNDSELHKEVTDTMLGEIQSFIVDNNKKELSFRTLDTLFPLIKHLCETHTFIINIGIILPNPFKELKNRAKSERLLKISNNITDTWGNLGLVEKTVIDEIIIEKHNYQYPYEGCILKVLSKYPLADFIYKIKTFISKKSSSVSENYFHNASDIKFEKEKGVTVIKFYYGK